MKQTESIQFLDNLGSGPEVRPLSASKANAAQVAGDGDNQESPHPVSGSSAPPSHPFGDIWSAAERMAQFDDDAKQAQARATAQANLAAMRNTLASAISDQLVDFDIQGPGEATCWLNDLEIGLEFEYEVDSEGPEPTTHHIQIVGSWNPNNWALIELTPEQERQAEADLLKIYPQWIKARRSEEGE